MISRRCNTVEAGVYGPTADLALVESKEETNNRGNKQEKTNKVKFPDVFTKRFTMVWIQVKGEEQKRKGDPSSRSA